MIGHFENVVGKDSYLTYDPLVRFILIPKILLVDDLMMKKDVSLTAN